MFCRQRLQKQVTIIHLTVDFFIDSLYILCLCLLYYLFTWKRFNALGLLSNVFLLLHSDI